MRAGLILRALMRLRTRSTRISAPAPGSERIPAACSRRRISRGAISSICASPLISETESEWMSTAGKLARTRSNKRSNHSSRSSGLTPPWIMICVAP